MPAACLRRAVRGLTPVFALACVAARGCELENEQEAGQQAGVDVAATLRPAPCSAATYEPNDEAEQACSIGFEGARTSDVVGQVTSSTDPNDYYAIEGVSADRTYTLEVEASEACSSGIRSTIGLRRGVEFAPLQGTAVHYDGRTYREFTPTESGAAILGFNGSCAYTWRVLRSTEDGLEHDPVTFEPNNSPTTGAQLVFEASGDSLANGQVTEKSDPADFYSFDVEAAHTYTQELRPAGACSGNALTTSVTFVGPEGSAPFAENRNWTSGLLMRELSMTRDGKAVIQVSGNCAYELAVRRSTADGLAHDIESFEPNNSLTTAAPIGVGQDVSSLVDLDTDPDDFFELEVQAGGVYSLELTRAAACPNNSIGTDVSLVGPEGPYAALALQYQNAETALPRDFSASADGLAIIHVRGTCSYGLVVNQGTAPGG